MKEVVADLMYSPTDVKLGGIPSYLRRYLPQLLMGLRTPSIAESIWAAGSVDKAMLETSLGVEISRCSSVSTLLASHC